MIFSSRKVNELYQRYCRQVLKILRSPSYDLTGDLERGDAQKKGTSEAKE